MRILFRAGFTCLTIFFSSVLFTCTTFARALNSTSGIFELETVQLRVSSLPKKFDTWPSSTHQLVFTHSSGLDSLNFTTLETRELLSSGDPVFQADALYDGEGDVFRLFWSDLQHSTIHGATYRGGIDDGLDDVHVVATVGNGVGVVEGIALDWIGLNLYFVDSRFGQIGVVGIKANISGSTLIDEKPTMVMTLLTDLELPRAIAVDSVAGLLFWTDWDQDAPRIERCSLSGAERGVLVKTSSLPRGGGFPNGLAIDYARRRIYWIDAKSSGIYSTDYDGNDNVELLSNNPAIQWPFGLSIFENSLFWVDAGLKTINQITTNSTDVHVIYKTYHNLYGILVLNPNKHLQYDYENPCANNGGCSHLCTIQSGGRRSTCHCPHMMSLSTEDQKTCHNVRDVVLVSENLKGMNFIQVLDAENVDFRVVAFSLVAGNSADLLGLSMDLTINTIYWANDRTNTVWKASAADGKISRVYDLGFGNLTGFATDLKSKKFYYSMLGPHAGIFECHLRPNYRCRRILSDVVERPLELFFQPERRQLYWIEMQSSRTYALRTCRQDPYTGGFAIIQDVFETSPADVPINLSIDSDGTIFWRSIDDERAVRMLAGNVSSIISIPDWEIGIVTAMAVAKNHSLLVAMSSGRVLATKNDFIVNNNNNNNGLPAYIITDREQDGRDLWSSTDYKSKGTIGGFAYATSASLATDESESAPTTLISDPTNPPANCSVTGCLNDGVCPTGINNDAVVPLVCDCPKFYRGDRCETTVCSRIYCKNGGRCNLDAISEKISCDCISGWRGSRCQFRALTEESPGKGVPEMFECDLVCLNDGVCIRVANDDSNSSPSKPLLQYCGCPEPYFGSRCQMDKREHAMSTTDSTSVVMAMGLLLLTSVVATVLYFIYKQRWPNAKTVICTNIEHKYTEMGIIPEREPPYCHQKFVNCQTNVTGSAMNAINIDDRLKLLS